MGIQVELRLGGSPVRALPDPSGGSFDRAGDFDRLLRHHRSALLGRLDPHGETSLDHGVMPALIAEIDVLLEHAAPGPERRGLLRLRTLATHCAEDRGRLVFTGD